LQIVLALRDGPELAIINLDAAEQADHRQRRLLRARRERPRYRRTADKRDEVAPFHVEHGDFLPCALSAPPTGPYARFSARAACSGAVRKSLGQT